MNSYQYFALLGLIFLCGAAADDDVLTNTAKVGDRVVLPCYYSSSSGSSSSAVRWLRGNQMISYDTTVHRDKAKFEIEKPVSSEWNLIINNVEQTDGAIYSCKTMENGEDTIIEQRRLQVETKPEIDERASSPTSIDVQEGENKTIWCNVSGTPVPTVTWQRLLGRDDPSVDIGASGNELMIHNMTRYASDTYICKVTNKHDTRTRGITVTVKFPVRARVYQDEVTANVGEEVFMACMVEGEPILDAYWKYVDGKKIDTNWKFLVTNESQQGFPMRHLTLTIRDTQLDNTDYGAYTCYVAGENSKYESRIQLRRAVTTPSDVYR